jgi:hypothetical protein
MVYSVWRHDGVGISESALVPKRLGDFSKGKFYKCGKSDLGERQPQKEEIV